MIVEVVVHIETFLQCHGCVVVVCTVQTRRLAMQIYL